MPTTDLETLLDTAKTVAWRGGRTTLAHFNADVSVELKADDTPVTIADREAERVMREVIGARYPDHAILGEEHGASDGDAAYRWILDPIDGTKSFIRGVPLYGTLVAVERDGEPVVGVIYLPGTDEMIAAATGQGCTWNGRRAAVSGLRDLRQALVVTTDFDFVRARLGAVGYDALCDATGLRRTWSDCYAYALLATGRADVAMDAGLAPWDYACLKPIIEEAGGRIGGFAGPRIVGGDVLATNGHLHDAMLALTSGAEPSATAP